MSSIKLDNIFNVVTSHPEESNELQLRADFIIVIRDIIIDKGLKHEDVVKKLLITEMRANDLLNGRIETFSTSLLITYLYRLGFRFNPVYENHKLSVSVQTVT